MIDFLLRIVGFILLALIQGLFLNQVNIMGYATPIVFIFFLLTFRRNTPRVVLLLWGFAMGLVMDVFTNTPGVGATSCTLLGMLQPWLLEKFVPRDSADDLNPTIKQLGMVRFCGYLLLATFIFYAVYYLLLVFSLAHREDALINILGGTALSFILMLGINALFRRP